MSHQMTQALLDLKKKVRELENLMRPTHWTSAHRDQVIAACSDLKDLAADLFNKVPPFDSQVPAEWKVRPGKDGFIHRLEFRDGVERVRCGARLASSVVVGDDSRVTCPECLRADRS